MNERDLQLSTKDDKQLFIAFGNMYTKRENRFVIPFVVAISGTKFLTNSMLVYQNSTQLRT